MKNNTTITSATGSEETVSVSKSIIKDLLDLSSNLKGEEAVEEIIRFIDYPNDSESGMYALRNLVRFYSNVRFLTKTIKETFNPQN